jgi:hypothetical protein
MLAPDDHPLGATMLRGLAGILCYYAWAFATAGAAFIITKNHSPRVRTLATAVSFLVPASLTTALIAWVIHVGDK